MNDSSTNGRIPIESRKSMIWSALKNEYRSLLVLADSVPISSDSSA